MYVGKYVLYNVRITKQVHTYIDYYILLWDTV